MKGKFTAFLAGCLVGAVAALLYAPRTGDETRALVADKANDAWGSARHYGSEAQVRGREIYGNVAEQGKAAYESAASNIRQAYDSVSANAHQAYSSAAAGARDAVSTAQARMSDVRDNAKPVFEERNDDLRAKIEAARQRIAAQVAKNAEEANTAAEEVIDADPVELEEAEGEAIESAEEAEEK